VPPTVNGTVTADVVVADNCAVTVIVPVSPALAWLAAVHCTVGVAAPEAGASDAAMKAYLTDVQVGSGSVVPAAVVVVVEPIVKVYKVPLAVSKRSVYPVGTVTFPAVVPLVFNA
jgi:hypothetical protein